MEAELGVLVHRLIVIVRRQGGFLQLDVEIANAVIDGEVGIGLTIRFLHAQRFEPDLDRPLWILGFETLRFFFELLEFRHWND